MIDQNPSIARLPRILLAWTIIAALVLVALAAFTAWLMFGSCENTVLSETLSPDEKLKVVVFERVCSHMVAWTTHASVLPAEAPPPNGVGNAFVGLERHGPIEANTNHWANLTVRWKDATTVMLIPSIEYHTEPSLAVDLPVQVLIVPQQ